MAESSCALRPRFPIFNGHAIFDCLARRPPPVGRAVVAASSPGGRANVAGDFNPRWVTRTPPFCFLFPHPDSTQSRGVPPRIAANNLAGRDFNPRGLPEGRANVAGGFPIMAMMN